MRDILRVNMTDLSTSWEPLPEGWALYGGRALTDAIVYNEVPADSDPLGPANALGVLARHARRDDGPQRRSSVRGREEPAHRRHQGVELGRPGRALAGTSRHRGRRRHRQAGRSRARATRSPSRPTARVKLERADAWAGLGNYETVDAIAATRPEGDRYATVTNGPAGEALAKAAGIAISDPKGYPNRFAGRGGLGAVMGSKGLKAIVVSDKGASFLEHADKEAFVAAIEALHDRAQGARRVRHRPADVRHQRADQHPVRGRRPADPQLLLGNVRVRRRDRRRDASARRSSSAAAT